MTLQARDLFQGIAMENEIKRLRSLVERGNRKRKGDKFYCTSCQGEIPNHKDDCPILGKNVTITEPAKGDWAPDNDGDTND